MSRDRPLRQFRQPHRGPYTYDAYGICFSGGTQCGAGIPFRFTGQRYDPETGTYYYRARYYDLGLGRFLETDPIGYTDDVDAYTYVGNDPTDRADPSGMVDQTGYFANFGYTDYGGFVASSDEAKGIE